MIIIINILNSNKLNIKLVNNPKILLITFKLIKLLLVIIMMNLFKNKVIIPINYIPNNKYLIHNMFIILIIVLVILLKNINQRNIKSDIKHRFMMLAGQSYMETEQFEECVTLLSPGIVKKLGVLTPEEQERENKKKARLRL